MNHEALVDLVTNTLIPRIETLEEQVDYLRNSLADLKDMFEGIDLDA
jgi:hypothetical protein